MYFSPLWQQLSEAWWEDLIFPSLMLGERHDFRTLHKQLARSLGGVGASLTPG